MKTTVKNLSDTRVQLTITLDTTDLQDAEMVALKKLSKDIKVDGFRKGHVPLAVVAKHTDPAVLGEQVLENAISKSVATAFTDQDIRALERPAVEVKKYVPGEQLEFTAESDILPAITLGDYKKLKYAPKKVVIEAERVTEVVDRILASMTEKKPVSRAAKEKDEAIIDFVGKKDGKKFDGGAAEDHALLLGSNSFIPGFEDQIIGHKAGDAFDIEVTFPEDYHAEELKGAPVTFSIVLKSVNEIVVPKLTDEVAAKIGPFTTAAELKADIKRELTAREEQEAVNDARNDLVEQLIAKSKVPLPETLVVGQMESLKRDHEQNLTTQGATLAAYLEANHYKDEEDWTAREVRPVAEKRVRVGLIVAELAKVLGTQATSEDLAAELERYRQQYGGNADVLKQLETAEVQREIANQILSNKAVEQLVTLNTPKATTKKSSDKTQGKPTKSTAKKK